MNVKSVLLEMTKPHATVTDHGEARRMRALAAVSLFLALSTCLNALAYVWTQTPGNEPVRNQLALSSALFFSTYVLLRTKWRFVGIYLCFATLILLVQGRVLDPNVPPESLMLGLIFACVIQTAGVLVFSFRSGIMFSIVNYLLVILTFVLRPDIRTPNGIIIAFFVLSQSVFTVLLSGITNIEREIASKISAMMAVSEIVAGIAHNLNSPLSAAKMMINRLHRILESRNPAQMDHAIDLSAKFGSKVGAALSISKSLQYFVERKPDLHSEGKFELVQICKDAIARSKELFHFDEIEVKFDPTKLIHLQVIGNPDRFTHALENIISGSAKLLPSSAPGFIAVDIEDQPYAVVVKIGDSADMDLKFMKQLVNDEFSSSSQDKKGDYLEVRLAKPLFEKCGAMFDIGSNPAVDRYIITIKK